jgi:hypothetical protein
MKSSHLSTTVCEGNRVHGRVILLRDFCPWSFLRNWVPSIFWRTLESMEEWLFPLLWISP